jgi:type VI secretion system secreted protein VgrG
MPHVPLQAKVLVHGQEVSIGKVAWEMYLSGQYRVRSADNASYTQQAYKMPAGTTSTKPGAELAFELAPAQILGGKLEINATFEGDGELAGITAKKSVTGCKVTGKNPARADVESLIIELGGDLAWAFLRIFYWESVHKLAQFATRSGGGNTPGEPLYGPPSGVGIVQRDPTLSEWRFPKTNRLTLPNNFFPRIFWDWKKNVEEGVSSFKSDYMNRGRRELEALRRENKHLPAFPEELVMRAAIRHYNGGNEYTSQGGKYLVSPSSTNNPGYVTNVLTVAEVDATKWPIPAAANATSWP